MDQIVKDLEVLCGPTAGGRLAGTPGARFAADYIARELKAIGLTPIGKIEFMEPVEIHAARLTGPVVFKVGNRKFKHRKEYGEISQFSVGGNFNGPLVIVRDGDEIKEDILAQAIVLIPETPQDFSLEDTIEAAVTMGVQALLIEAGEPAWFYKSVFGSNENKIPVFRVCTSLAEQLVQFEGEHVQIELPMEVGKRPVKMY